MSLPNMKYIVVPHILMGNPSPFSPQTRRSCSPALLLTATPMMPLTLAPLSLCRDEIQVNLLIPFLVLSLRSKLRPWIQFQFELMAPGIRLGNLY